MNFQLSMFSPAIINVQTVYFIHALSLTPRIIFYLDTHVGHGSSIYIMENPEVLAHSCAFFMAMHVTACGVCDYLTSGLAACKDKQPLSYLFYEQTFNAIVLPQSTVHSWNPRNAVYYSPFGPNGCITYASRYWKSHKLRVTLVAEAVKLSTASKSPLGISNRWLYYT